MKVRMKNANDDEVSTHLPSASPHGHSAAKAMAIIADARRGDAFAVMRIKLLAGMRSRGLVLTAGWDPAVRDQLGMMGSAHDRHGEVAPAARFDLGRVDPAVIGRRAADRGRISVRLRATCATNELTGRLEENMISHAAQTILAIGSVIAVAGRVTERRVGSAVSEMGLSILGKGDETHSRDCSVSLWRWL